MAEDIVTEPASTEEPVVTDASLENAAGESTIVKEAPKTQGSEDLGAVETPAVEKEPVVEVQDVGAIVPAPTEKVADAEHQESSKLGRKFSDLKGENQTLRERLDALEKRTQEPVVTEEEEFLYPTTKAELHQQFQEFQNKQQQDVGLAKSKYQDGYLEKLTDLTDGVDPGQKKLIMDEMGKPESPFNVKLSDNPHADAETNYLKAQNFVLTNQVKSLRAPLEPENPLKGNPPTEALGVGGGSKVVARSAAPIKLDPEAQAFKESCGFSDEDVADAINGGDIASETQTGIL